MDLARNAAAFGGSGKIGGLFGQTYILQRNYQLRSHNFQEVLLSLIKVHAALTFPSQHHINPPVFIFDRKVQASYPGNLSSIPLYSLKTIQFFCCLRHLFYQRFAFMRCAWRCDSRIKVGLYFWHIIFTVIGIGNERDNQVFEVNAPAYLVYTLLQEALPVTRARSCNQRSTYAEHRSLPAHTNLSVSPALCIDVHKL